MTIRRSWSWVALGVVVVVALAFGARSPGHQTPQQKAASIAGEVRCPTCEGQSAELSDAPAAAAVRQFILTQVEAGQGRSLIEEELRDRYGTDILLRPPASGIAGLVWVLPVVALILAFVGIAFAFRRWRLSGVTVTDADRELVARALPDAAAGPPPPESDGGPA
jgi:cytochrome c-type biogenesis protein CcmH